MPKKIINNKTLPTLALINFIFALFVDTMFIYKEFQYKSIETLVYLVVFNLSFIIFTALTIIRSRKAKEKKKISFKALAAEYLPVTLVALIFVVLALSCFNTTSVYDGHLYYGSFLQSINAFDLTAKSAIGDFIQWGHNFIGSAIIIAPFELLMFGDMVGSYFANTLLFAITLYILYAYMRDMFKALDKWAVALVVAAFAFMPYAFSIVTYFCPDFYLQLYIVWLLYAYKKDNQLMVSFIGFITCFTTDSGAFIYGFLVLFLYLVDANTKYGYKKLEWLKLKNIPFIRFIIWLNPAILYAVYFLLKSRLQEQTFVGSEQVSFGITAFDFTSQTLISFIFGLRWVIVGLFVIAVIVLIMNKNAPDKLGIKKLDIDYRNIFIALGLATVSLHILLSLFTLSHCPRYTAPINVLLAFLLAYSISVIFASNKTKQVVVSLLMSGLMLVQSYITIDPAIKALCRSMDTGDYQIYDLGNTRNNHDGKLVDFFSETIGDYYVYNREYSVANALTRKALKTLDFKEDVCVYVYDDYYCYYELHVSGLQYTLFWDTVKKKQTYSPNENTIFINSCALTDDVLENDLGEYIIVLVPARVNSDALTEKLNLRGYNKESQLEVGNVYGKISVLIYHTVQ